MRQKKQKKGDGEIDSHRRCENKKKRQIYVMSLCKWITELCLVGWLGEKKIAWSSKI